MGRARHPGPNRRFCSSLERKDGDCCQSGNPMAQDRRQPVLRLAKSLRESERAQRLDTARPLAGRLGETSNHRFSSRESIGRISSTDIHDAGSQYRCGQSVQCLESAESGWATATMEPEGVAERQWIPAAVEAARALARRCVVHQYFRNFLLFVQRAGWRQPLHRALGNSGIDERTGSRNHSATSGGKVSGSEATDHFRQRAAVYRERLQGIRSDLRHDACPDISVLSAIEWQDRTLAQIDQNRMHPARCAVIAGRCGADRGSVDSSLQHGPASQRDWLCRAVGQAGGSRNSNLHGARSQTGRGSAKTTTTSATNHRLWQRSTGYSKLTTPGKAEAGAAGTQPRQGIARWAHRHDDGTRGFHFASHQHHRTIDPYAFQNPITKCSPSLLLIPAIALAYLITRRYRLYLTERGLSPIHAEPGQNKRRFLNRLCRHVVGTLSTIVCRNPLC